MNHWWLLSRHGLTVNTRGDQKFLQLVYKKLTLDHILCHFWHILLQHQCIFSTFLLSCFCPENRIFCFFWLSNHALTTIISDSSSVNQVPRRTDFLLGNGSQFWTVSRMVQLNKFTVMESLLSNQWLARWCIVMKKSDSWVTTFVSVSASRHRITWMLLLHNAD